MPHYIITFLVFGIPVGLAIYCMWELDKSTRKVYANLDALWDRAKAAKTREELVIIRNELYEFHNKYCVMRHFGDYARRVLAYINGKLAGMP